MSDSPPVDQEGQGFVVVTVPEIAVAKQPLIVAPSHPSPPSMTSLNRTDRVLQTRTYYLLLTVRVFL